METVYGAADVKVCSYKGKQYCYPEYDSVSAICDKQGNVDFNTVYEAVEKGSKGTGIKQAAQAKIQSVKQLQRGFDSTLTNRGQQKQITGEDKKFIIRPTVKETGRMEGQNHSVKERLEQLETFMGKYTAGGKDLCVAFSGGVDSSLILKAAVKAATKDGSKVFAVTFDSRLHPSCDLEIANRVAAELGGVHKVIHVNELEQEAIRMNPVNRCYLCKKHLFVNLKEMAKSLGAETVMDGTNEDDHHVYRPGIQALKELGIVSPLAQLHITKAEVKAMAKEWGISVASARQPHVWQPDCRIIRRSTMML